MTVHLYKLIKNSLLSDPCPIIVLPWYSNRSSSSFRSSLSLYFSCWPASSDWKCQPCNAWFGFGHQFPLRQFTTGFKSRSFCKYWLCVMMKLYYGRTVMITVGKTSGSCGVRAIFQACCALLFSVRTHTCFCKSVFCAAIHKWFQKLKLVDWLKELNTV